MILNSSQIAHLLEAQDEGADPLVITPFPNIEKVRASGSASIDLRLGCWFVTLRRPRTSELTFADPTEPSPSEARLTKKHYIPFGKKFVLHPGCFVLGITLEWIRLKRNLAGYVTGRSSWGRRGLVIATAIGVHPGFTGCLTLELSNMGEVPLKIQPGTRICQLFLHEVEPQADQLVGRGSFNAKRQPVLGIVRVDEFAEKLANPLA